MITEYIAAYIQILYKGDAVHPTGLTVKQGCRQLSTGYKFKIIVEFTYCIHGNLNKSLNTSCFTKNKTKFCHRKQIERRYKYYFGSRNII
jgi:hypothetical protein